MTNQEQPISVNGSITPITKKPIQVVKSNQWHTMSVSELYDQVSILQGRMVIANQLGSYSLLQQLQFGLSQLTALIEQKSEQLETR